MLFDESVELRPEAGTDRIFFHQDLVLGVFYLDIARVRKMRHEFADGVRVHNPITPGAEHQKRRRDLRGEALPPHRAHRTKGGHAG